MKKYYLSIIVVMLLFLAFIFDFTLEGKNPAKIGIRGSEFGMVKSSQASFFSTHCFTPSRDPRKLSGGALPALDLICNINYTEFSTKEVIRNEYYAGQ